jgi:hypothetical protein
MFLQMNDLDLFRCHHGKEDKTYGYKRQRIQYIHVDFLTKMTTLPATYFFFLFFRAKAAEGPPGLPTTYYVTS